MFGAENKYCFCFLRWRQSRHKEPILRGRGENVPEKEEAEKKKSNKEGLGSEQLWHHRYVQ
jgi:hypothetical protein